MKNLYIYGAGGAGREICDTVRDIQIKEKRWHKIYFIDDTIDPEMQKEIYGESVITYEMLRKMAKKEETEIVIAVGEPLARKILFEKVVADGYQFATIICPNAIVSSSAQIGQGVVVQAFCHIASDAVIEENVYLNYSCIIGHDTIVKKNTTMAMGCIVGGCCEIGNDCFLGMQSVVRDHTKVGDLCIVGMSSVVTKDVENEKVVVGMPARMIKKNTDKRVFK